MIVLVSRPLSLRPRSLDSMTELSSQALAGCMDEVNVLLVHNQHPLLLLWTQKAINPYVLLSSSETREAEYAMRTVVISCLH